MSLSWLMRQLEPAPHRRPDLHFVLYSRAGCHLCDVAWELLVEYKATYGFTLAKVEVDEDPQLIAQYGLCVPVVVLNGKVRFRGDVNKVLLERILQKEPRSQ